MNKLTLALHNSNWE